MTEIESQVEAREPASPARIVEHIGPAASILVAAQRFIADAEALQELFEVATPVLVAKATEYRVEMESMLANYLREPKKNLQMNLGELNRLSRLNAKQVRGHFLFRGHLLVALVSRFDAFISAVCFELLSVFPDRLAKKTISFADTTQFRKIEELKKKIIQDEIDEQMRGSHAAQLEFLSSIANVPLGDDEPELLSKFVELTERRNCHIHFGGLASQQYLQVCSKYKVIFPNTPEEGAKLNVGQKYLDSSRRVLSEMAFKIAQTIVRKVFNESKDLADAYVNEIGLQMLDDHREKEALMIFNYAVQLKGKWAGDESSKRIFVINKAQTLVRLGRGEQALQEIGLIDWSAAHPKFILAIHLLKNEFDAAAKLMPIAGINEEYYRKWPLMEAFRRTDEFKRGFLTLFDHDFEETELKAVTEAIAHDDDKEVIPILQESNVSGKSGPASVTGDSQVDLPISDNK
jgi:hypothetical protein